MLVLTTVVVLVEAGAVMVTVGTVLARVVDFVIVCRCSQFLIDDGNKVMICGLNF